MINSPHTSRLAELVALDAAGACEREERAELDRLVTLDPKARRAAERFAAALELAMVNQDRSSQDSAPLTAQLRQALMQQARDHFSTQAGSITSTKHAQTDAPFGGVIARIARSRRLAYLTAAACLAVAALVAFPARTRPAPDPTTELVAQLHRTADTVTLAFSPGVGEYAPAHAEIIWSDQAQRGYLRLSGIAPNDPSRRQFQLWIVDPARDTHPVDGGVFDVTSSGEVIIPVTSRLRVTNPTVFAITSEKPGGVVVSGGPLLLIASRS